MEVYGAAPNRTKVKRRKAWVPLGKLAFGGKAQYSSGGPRSGDGVGAKFCVLTRRDLLASAARNRKRNSSRTKGRDEEGTRGVGWSRNTGRPAKAGSNRQKAGREGDHGQQRGKAARTVSRDSRQPERVHRPSGSGPTRACAERGAEVGERGREDLAAHDDGGGSERRKPEKSVRASEGQQRRTWTGPAKRGGSGEGVGDADTGAVAVAARRDIPSRRHPAGMDTEERWRAAGPWHTERGGPRGSAGRAPSARSAL